MKAKKIIAVIMSLCMVAGEVSYSAPFISQNITAQAYSVYWSTDWCSYDSNGVLTLYGEVDGDALRNRDDTSLAFCRSIVAKPGTILPKNCDKIFSNFRNCTSIDLSYADTSKVNSMNRMFSNCSKLTNLNISGFNTSNVTGMKCMFLLCNSLTKLDVSGFDTRKVTDMGSMFSSCKSLTKLDVSGFDTRKVTDMGSMFSSCENLTKLDVSGFDTSNVTSMQGMFSGCSSLSKLDVSNFDTCNVTSMITMFCNCSRLTTLDVSNFDTRKVIKMTSMFNNCSGLSKLDLSNFDTSNVTIMDLMFSNCSSLKTLTLGKNFKNIKESAELANSKGWVNVNAPSTVISGGGDYAVIKNNGKNTYKLYGTITYPTNIKVTYNLEYRQARLTWDEVVGAERYAIAVYVAGKWRAQTSSIPVYTCSYVTPKNSLTPGAIYKVAVAARVNGVWDAANAIKNAVLITIPSAQDTDNIPCDPGPDGDYLNDDIDYYPNQFDYIKITDENLNDGLSVFGGNPPLDSVSYLTDGKLCHTTVDGGDAIKNCYIFTRKTGKKPFYFKLEPIKDSDYKIKISNAELEDVELNLHMNAVPRNEHFQDRVDIGNSVEYTLYLEKGIEYTIEIVNNSKLADTCQVKISQDNWVYAPDGGIRYSIDSFDACLGKDAIDGNVKSYSEYADVYFSNSVLLELLNSRSQDEGGSRLNYYTSDRVGVLSRLTNFFFDDKKTLGIDKNSILEACNKVGTAATYLGVLPGTKICSLIVGGLGAAATLESSIIMLDNDNYQKFENDLYNAYNSCRTINDGDINLCYTHYKTWDNDNIFNIPSKSTVNTWSSWWPSSYIPKYEDGHRFEVTKGIDYEVFDLADQ